MSRESNLNWKRLSQARPEVVAPLRFHLEGSEVYDQREHRTLTMREVVDALNTAHTSIVKLSNKLKYGER